MHIYCEFGNRCPRPLTKHVSVDLITYLTSVFSSKTGANEIHEGWANVEKCTSTWLNLSEDLNTRRERHKAWLVCFTEQDSRGNRFHFINNKTFHLFVIFTDYWHIWISDSSSCKLLLKHYFPNHFRPPTKLYTVYCEKFLIACLKYSYTIWLQLNAFL